MNDDPSELERELRRRQPISPSDRLLSRLSHVLDHQEKTVSQPMISWWQRLGFNRPAAAFCWGLLSPAAAAGVAVLVLSHLHADEPLPSPQASSRNPAAEPASASDDAHGAKAVNMVYEASDEGVFLDNAKEPVRRVRYRSADRVRWDNPQTGAQWEISYPREDIMLVRVKAE